MTPGGGASALTTAPSLLPSNKRKLSPKVEKHEKSQLHFLKFSYYLQEHNLKAKSSVVDILQASLCETHIIKSVLSDWG